MAKAKAVAEAKFARRAHAEEKARAIAEAKLARIARAEAYFYAQREYLSDGATKKCRRCREIRTIDLFPPNGRQKDGLNMQCVVCIRTMILERNLKTQIYYGTNIEAIRARTQIYRRENPEVGLAASHRHRTHLKNNGGSFTGEQIIVMREAQNHQCAYCQRAIKLTIDHIHPVSKGGSSDISNICLACRKCNSSKGAKLLEEWVNRWYERDR